MKIAKSIIFLILALFFSCNSYGQICLKLSDDDGYLSVSLSNYGKLPIIINKRFLIEPLKGELTLNFEGNKRSYKLTAMVRLSPVEREDYVTLMPGEFSGHRFAKEYLRDLYSLTGGCYRVSAVYEDHWRLLPDSYKGQISSEPVKLCI